MKKYLSILLAVFLVAALTACTSAPASSSQPGEPSSTQPQEPTRTQPDTSDQAETPVSQGENTEEASMNTQSQNVIGAMSPEEALEYMKTTENLVIVDVAATRWYNAIHFEGAINIPIEELNSEEEDELYMQIPSDRPVILHCRAGAIVPGAYRRVLELRSDIPEISYIAGSPMFDEYNEWLAEQ